MNTLINLLKLTSHAGEMTKSKICLLLKPEDLILDVDIPHIEPSMHTCTSPRPQSSGGNNRYWEYLRLAGSQSCQISEI